MNPDQKSIDDAFSMLSVTIAKLIKEGGPESDDDKTILRNIVGEVLRIGHIVVSDLHRIADAIEESKS